MITIKKVYYKDLKNIQTIENNESFISLSKNWILCSSQDIILNSESQNSKEIIVRIWVYEWLLRANRLLKEMNNDYEICVVYWYRSIEVQIKTFLEILKNKIKIYYKDADELYEEVHKDIAVPSVSGHPTWWAVDVLIYNKKTNKFLDFWSFIYDFRIDWFNSILNEDIPEEPYNNRIFLSTIMTQAWFAPYYWEYWHFSLGDKEWAFYYDKEYAIYTQKTVSELGIVI